MIVIFFIAALLLTLSHGFEYPQVQVVAPSAGANCTCVAGVYLKDFNGQCTGEIKKISVSEEFDCVEVLTSRAYLNVTRCDSTELDISIYATSKCLTPLDTAVVKDGQCHDFTADGHTLSIMATCNFS